MSETDLYRNAVLLLIGIATAITGWLHARRTGIKQAELRLARVQRRTAALRREREREEKRLVALTLEDFERRLRACEERWNRWAGGPVG